MKTQICDFYHLTRYPIHFFGAAVLMSSDTVAQVGRYHGPQ
jgi:hypothetical protein